MENVLEITIDDMIAEAQRELDMRPRAVQREIVKQLRHDKESMAAIRAASTCPDCHGTGSCPKCRGRGMVDC